MPSSTSLTLAAADLSDSTVDEVYNVIDRREGITTFRYVGTNPLAMATRLTVSVKQPKASSKYARVVLTFVKPEVYTDSDTQLIEQNLINRVNIEFQIDKNATLSQVTSCTERILAMLANSDVQTAINNLETFY
jgi:hypothetical protein